MKRTLLVFILLFILAAFSYAAQKINLTNQRKFVPSFTSPYTSNSSIVASRLFARNTDASGNYPVSLYSSGSGSGLVNAGRALTITGLAFLIIGPAFIGLSYLFLWLTFLDIMVQSMFKIVNWNLAWPSMFALFGSHGLASLACVFLISGIVLSVLSLILIPGIILWAVGASSRRSAQRIIPLKESFGFAVRIKKTCALNYSN